MRKDVTLILILILSNCGSTDTRISKIQKLTNAQNFTVNNPYEWKPIIFHGHVGYTPIKKVDSLKNPFVSVFQYNLINKPNFKEFVRKQFEKTNGVLSIITQDFGTGQNELGEIYLHTFESTWNKNIIKTHNIYFEQNEEYYCFSYSSLKASYDKYFNDANAMLKSFKLKY
jgi:hypothetical protein